MEQQNFNNLLLRTAFSCMACDGKIDKREVKLIKTLSEQNKAFGEIDINAQLDILLHEINQDGHLFLRKYLTSLDNSDLNEKEELNIVKVSIDTILSDDELHYSEIKFFKIIRGKLNISDEYILETYPEIEEYLEQDIISESYLSGLQEDFFDTQVMPQFEPLNLLDDNFLDEIKKGDNE